MKIPVFFRPEMIASSGSSISPSAHKPKILIEALKFEGFPIEIREQQPVTRDDYYAVHRKEFVDGVLDLKIDNGFENKSADVAASLPYTSGAMLDAARFATKEMPACAPVSGFHHAEWSRAMGFCTFNGLMVAAYKLVKEGKKVAIIDCDMHYGNGTDNIMANVAELSKVYHLTFGKFYTRRHQAAHYLRELREASNLRADLKSYAPDVILYQAGADCHIDDPYGGVLTTQEMYERDVLMFEIARGLGIPICWNLAGGYQVEKDGSCRKVIDLHINTFKAAMKVYGVPMVCR